MRRLILTLLAAALTAGVAADTASARMGSCLVPGSSVQCHVWKGKVTFIDDGDTLHVDLAGDGTRRSIKVRVTGVNAMEQTVYTSNAARRRGECHAVEATALLEKLIKRSKGRVRLSAQDPSSRSNGRWRRSVAVKRGGRWRDVGRRLLANGLALWLPNRQEWAYNRDYSTLAERAAAKGVGIWDTDYCGYGPHEGAPLKLWANWDADGRDGNDINGEWIKIRNLDPVNEVSLGGWWVRDSALRRYVFPDYTTLGPGETLTVYVGDGPTSWTEFFWGLRRAAFDNITNNAKVMGDGAYLFDPQGDMRAWMTWPCRENCAHPYTGALQIDAKYKGRETIVVRNIAAFAVDLDGLRLASKPYGYAFPQGTVLAPGQELEIEVRGDPAADTTLAKSWGETGPILRNSGDRVTIETYRGVQLACFAYGDKSCSGT